MKLITGLIGMMIVSGICSGAPLSLIEFILYKNGTVIWSPYSYAFGPAEEIDEGFGIYSLEIQDKNEGVIKKVNFGSEFYFDAINMTEDGEIYGVEVEVNPTSNFFRMELDPRANYLIVLNGSKELGRMKIPVEKLCGTGRCEWQTGENFGNCPKDCISGGTDGYCDENREGTCDEDCTRGEDLDCGDEDEIDNGNGKGTDFTGVIAGIILILVAVVIFYLKKRR